MPPPPLMPLPPSLMPPLRVALVALLLSAAAYGVWEVRRWGTAAGRESLSARQRTLRVWGLFFLMLALGLCLGWTFLPRPQTRQALIGYAQYILLICLAVLPLVPLALMDWRENIRRLAESRRALLAEALSRSPDPPA